MPFIAIDREGNFRGTTFIMFQPTNVPVEDPRTSKSEACHDNRFLDIPPQLDLESPENLL
jgi:hypothetical protein